MRGIVHGIILGLARAPRRLWSDREGRLWALALAGAGGFLGRFCFELHCWRALALLAPVAAFLGARQGRSAAEAGGRVLAFGTFFYFGALFWLTEVGRYAPVAAVADFGVFVLGFYVALYPALGAYALRRWAWPAGPAAQYGLFACVWLLAEWLRTLGRLAMPLAQIGHAWATWPLAIQPAEALGELGVSAEVLLAGGAAFLCGLGVWRLAVRRRPSMLRPEVASAETAPSAAPGGWLAPLLGGLAATALVAGAFLGDRALLAHWQARLQAIAAAPDARRLSVALVQPGIEQPVKLASYASQYADVQALLRDAIELIEESLALGLARPDWDAAMARVADDRHVDDAYRQAFGALRDRVLAHEAALPGLSAKPLGVDLLVLPETAFGEWDFAVNPQAQARVGAMTRRSGAAMLVGAGHVEGTDAEPRYYNSAYLVHADGRLDPRVYDKMRLIPFGECLPYFDLIPGFQEYVVGIGSFSEGKRPTIFEIPTRKSERGNRNAERGTRPARLGVLICFESTFSAMARQVAGAGADLMTVITNDAWYGRSAGAAAHHDLSLLRAVETRRWILRCANTGISSLIDPAGRVVATLPLGRSGLARGEVALPASAEPQPLTFFSRHGNAWLLVPVLALVAGFFMARRRRAHFAAVTRRLC
jgi:apolipoprotein N-acyltransferase